MNIRIDEITNILREEIKGFQKTIDISEVGNVVTIGDGVARVFGLENAMVGEMVTFQSGQTGLVLNLESDSVGIVVMGEGEKIREGDIVKRSGKIF